VLFLGASSPTAPQNNLIGGLVGLAAAALLGWLLFSGGKKVPLKPFFLVTNTLLVLLGAGLASRALGEFGEAGWVPGLVSPVWNLNPGPLADGSVAWWHEDGAVGGLFKSLFGYVGAPNLVQVLGYALYLGAALALMNRNKPKPR
jgi:high-affinity iron transporter